jgi:capsular exopolysaccharide synthesis family protein
MSTEDTRDLAQRQVNITDIILLTLRRWPWIVLSLAVCLGAAIFYLLRTPPVYTRTASIVIKDESKGASVSSEVDAFSNMGLLQTHSNINDEVNKLQSPDVMEEVVKRFNLDRSYYVNGRFHKEIIYGPQLPIVASFPSLMENGSASARIDVGEDGNYSLYDLKFGDEDASVVGRNKVALGDTVQTSGGPVVVSRTPYYKEKQSYEIFVSRIPVRSAVAKYSAELTVALKSDKGNTINISVTDQSIQRAEDLINGVISIYNENWIDNRNQISVSTSNFINERLGVIEGELGNVDQDISSYQSEHLIPDVQQAASMYMSENQAASAQILDLNNQLQMTRYMRSYLTNEANRSTVLPANSGIGNSSIEGQIAEYNALMLQRNQYAANSSDTHPVVMDMDAQLAGMRSAIISTIDNQVIALNTQIKNLQSNKNRTTAQIAANPNQAKYLLSVERQQKVKESLYLFLLQKREENELSQAFTAYNTQIITRPTGSNAPTAPSRSKILLVAFVIGLIIPFGVTYLLETTNTKVRGRKDIEDLSLPFLGEIPTIPGTKKSKKDDGPKVVVKQGKRDVVNEAIRVLRTNIGFMSSKDHGCSVIMVTSFNPGSGKSFLTVNLGISFAIKGKKTLVIDCDLRRASASAFVDSPAKGLSNYLAGEVTNVKDVIVSNTITDGLSVLPVGTIPPNPAELLELPRFADMVNALRADYDYILIDCPPVEMMADAQIVESVTDRTIFVIRAGYFERTMLPEVERIYNEKKFKNMGVVLNATPSDATHHGYRYGYGYGYGYGNYNHYTSNE